LKGFEKKRTGTKTLHVITRMCLGGAQLNTLETCAELARRGYRVSLATGPEDAEERGLVEKARKEGVEVHVVPALCREISPLKDVRAGWELFGLIRRGGFSVVHTHTSKAGMLGRVAAAAAGVPVIVHTPHGHVFYGYYGRMRSRAFIQLERWASALTDAIIPLTSRGKEEYVRFSVGRREKLVPIHSGVRVEEVAALRNERARVRAEMGVDNEEILAGTVARLSPVKGVRYFLEAAGRVAEKRGEFRFVIVGEGELRRELEEKVKELGLGDKVRFLGFCGSDAARIMSGLDVFVLSSLNEGMGRVIVEAMALGIPVVATSVGGVPELVRDRVTGLLVPPARADALALAILEAVDKKGATAEMVGRAAAMARSYTVESMVDKIEELYQELLRRNGKRKNAFCDRR